MNAPDETIFAVASGAGQAAVAVLRISGPATSAILHRLTLRPPPPPRRASLRRLHERGGTVLDQALVLWMPGPASYTGEDSAELHVHAGPAVLEGIADALIALGARPADPGAFTRRAFLNGRMELTEAEAVADLIAAETEAQRSQALRQLDGALGQRFESWATTLRACLAEYEALIDFPEELADTPPQHAPLHALIAEIEATLADDHRGERLRGGLHFAVTGPPNVGKSSIVNALAGRDVAIVAPSAGTTRDLIEVRCVFGGVPVTLLDSAGVRDATDEVEAEGVRRARAASAAADLVIDVAAANDPMPPIDEAATIKLSNKIDLAPAAPGRLGVSVLTGAGLQDLRARLEREARRLTMSSGPAPLTRTRHRAACIDAVAHLQAALAAPLPELRAEDVRLAMRALGQVTGRVGVEDVLDVVFSQFCIGK